MSQCKRLSREFSQEDELNNISPRIVARRRKGRSVNVSTLPDHVQRLLETFSAVDIEGEGRVKASKVVDLVKQGYMPTEQEVGNVRRYFHLAEGEQLQFDALVCAFARGTGCVRSPAISSASPCPVGAAPAQADFQAHCEIFHYELMQVARAKEISHVGEDTAATISVAREVLGEDTLMELQGYFDRLTMASADEDGIVRELVRCSFVLPRKQVDQLMSFFDQKQDGMVSAADFIHGMTLLYGELQHLHCQLVSNTPGTPIMSPMSACAPSPLLSPSAAFDGPVSSHKMTDIRI